MLSHGVIPDRQAYPAEMHPLHLALKTGHYRVARLLLAYSARRIVLPLHSEGTLPLYPCYSGMVHGAEPLTWLQRYHRCEREGSDHPSNRQEDESDENALALALRCQVKPGEDQSTDRGIPIVDLSKDGIYQKMVSILKKWKVVPGLVICADLARYVRDAWHPMDTAVHHFQC